jgi:Uma2 family endonuclease
VKSVAPWAEDVLMSAGELMQLPDDEWCYELVDGRLVRMSPTGAEHSGVFLRLLRAVDQFNEDRGLGQVFAGEPGFWISPPGAPDTVMAPDIAFIRAERADAAQVQGYPRLAPDLVAEIVSPSQTRSEMAAKARRWLDAGVRLVWIVFSPAREIGVWRGGGMQDTLTVEDMLSGEDVLPGFAFPVKELFL